MGGQQLIWATVVVGVVVLTLLAWLMGHVEAASRDGAWRRIAAHRRELHEKEQSLLACFIGPRCNACPINKYLRDYYGA